MRVFHVLVAALAAVLVGCGSGPTQPDFPDLHPVKGVVKKGGQPVKGGSIQFNSDPPKPEFLINSDVADDGTFALSTVRTTDKNGERKSGAPAGNYKVTYSPPFGNQTTVAGPVTPIDLPKPVNVAAGTGDLTIELPGKK